MAFTFSTKGNSQDDASSDTITHAIAVGSGDLVVVMAKHEGSGGESITMSSSADGAADGHGTQLDHSSATLSVRFGYFLAHSAGTITFTATFGSAVPYRRILVFVHTHTGTASLDGDNGAEGSGTALASGNITTTGNDTVAFGGSGEYGSQAISSMQINGTAADQTETPLFYLAMWSKVFTSTFTGQATATLDSGNSWLCPVIAFKDVAGGAPATPTRTLMGVGT